MLDFVISTILTIPFLLYPLTQTQMCKVCAEKEREESYENTYHDSIYPPGKPAAGQGLGLEGGRRGIKGRHLQPCCLRETVHC